MGSIVYHCQDQQQNKNTIEIARIVSLIEPKYRGLGPMLKLYVKTCVVPFQLASCNTWLEFTSIKHRANLANRTLPAVNAQ